MFFSIVNKQWKHTDTKKNIKILPFISKNLTQKDVFYYFHPLRRTNKHFNFLSPSFVLKDFFAKNHTNLLTSEE